MIQKTYIEERLQWQLEEERARIRTLEAELNQAKADRTVLALCVLQFQQAAGIKDTDRHPLVADALSRAGANP